MELYILTCTVNNKKYVGLSYDAVGRSGKCGHSYHKNKQLYEDIKKYGWDKFVREVRLTNIPESEIGEYEKRYISILRTNNPQFGYNRHPGGGGRPCKIQSYSKEYSQQTHADYYEAHKEQISQYYQDNKEARDAYHTEWCRKNREKYNAYQREYQRRKKAQQNG